MSFKPNFRGPFVHFGEIAVAAAGVGSPFDVNWEPKLRGDTPVTAADPMQYSISLEDIIISSPSTNGGGIFIVSIGAAGTFDAGNVDTIMMFIPQGAPPVSLARFLTTNRFQPGLIGVDVEQNGDVAWAIGIPTS